MEILATHPKTCGEEGDTSQSISVTQNKTINFSELTKVQKSNSSSL